LLLNCTWEAKEFVMLFLHRALTALGVLCVPLIIITAFAEEAKKPAAAKMVHYSGKVQGVGFRAMAAEIAKGYAVTGWVKNLDDGRVQLFVEGSEEAVDKFLKAVREHWKDNIKKEQIEDAKSTGKFKAFEVVR
jgi:acylphosphatase